jgi:MFS family permease
MPTALDSDARWEAAALVAAGGTDTGFRRRRRLTLVWIFAVAVGSPLIGSAIGFWIAASVGNDRIAGGEPSLEGRVVLQLIFLGLGLTVGIGGFLWGVGTKRYVTRWRAISGPLSMAQKKSVRRQLLGKEPVDYGHLDVILAIAKQSQGGTQASVPLLGAVVLFAVSSAVSTNVFLYQVILTGSLLLFVAVGLQLAVAYRKTARFIQVHGAHEAGSGAEGSDE